MIEAPITEITGQDDSYLVEFFLKGCEVHSGKQTDTGL